MVTPTALPTRLRRFAVGALLAALSAAGARAQRALPPIAPSRAALAEFAPALGWSGPRPSAAMELRLALDDHFSAVVRAGTEPWRREVAAGYKPQLGGAEFRGATLEGLPTVGGGIRAYTGDGRTGVFGGVDLARQGYRIEAVSRLPREQPDPAAGAWGSPLSFLSGLISLAAGGGGDRSTSRATAGSATVLTLTGGYAVDLGPGERLELCARMVRRTLPGGPAYAVAGGEGDVSFDIADDFRVGTALAAEARWVLPLAMGR